MVVTSDHTGLVPFPAPHRTNPEKVPHECETWYRLVGTLDSPRVPLVVLHGGPGASHEYLLPLIDLNEQHNIPILFYDQLGNGKSTRLPHLIGDEGFWTEQLFLDELDNLLSHLGISRKPYDILGQSWGGMLGATWAAARPKNLRRLVLASSPASMQLWTDAANRLVAQLPEEMQEIIRRCGENDDYDNPEFESAVDLFYQHHLSLTRPWPCPEVASAINNLTSDPTTYSTMCGPSEFKVIGSLRDWNSIPYLNNIQVPTLLINGEQDEAQDDTVRPFFEHIPKVKWITIDNAAHLVHVDQRKRHNEHVAKFLLA